MVHNDPESESIYHILSNSDSKTESSVGSYNIFMAELTDVGGTDNDELEGEGLKDDDVNPRHANHRDGGHRAIVPEGGAPPTPNRQELKAWDRAVHEQIQQVELQWEMVYTTPIQNVVAARYLLDTLTPQLQQNNPEMVETI